MSSSFTVEYFDGGFSVQPVSERGILDLSLHLIIVIFTEAETLLVLTGTRMSS